MFDFHLHTRISFDSEASAESMVLAAERAQLREICFTDHYDCKTDPKEKPDLFSLDDYAHEYDGLSSDSVLIRRGVEYGLTEWNYEHARELLRKRDFDFVIGSVHYVDGYDPYYPEFWERTDCDTAFRGYLEQTLRCVRLHSDFDVLGHINYVCKSAHNPSHRPLRYEDYPELCDEIMRELVRKGKGMEINTSGIDRVGEALPSLSYIKRFRELGGEIVTIGSDAHDPSRVGQYTDLALSILRETFGYVCTFEGRRPIRHAL